MSSSDELAARLEKGEAMCATAPPDKRWDYDHHWMSLLHLYMTASYREDPAEIRAFNEERNVQPDKEYRTVVTPEPGPTSHQSALL